MKLEVMSSTEARCCWYAIGAMEITTKADTYQPKWGVEGPCQQLPKNVPMTAENKPM